MPITVEGEVYYTTAEAARALGIARETFTRNAAARLRSYEIGVLRRTYYLKRDVDALNGARPAEDDRSPDA